MGDAGYLWGGHVDLKFISRRRLRIEEAKVAAYGFKGSKTEGGILKENPKGWVLKGRGRR